MRPRRILAPVSYGPASEKAFCEAAALAATTGARLIVVNVRKLPLRERFGPGFRFDTVSEEARLDRKARLEDFVKRELESLGISPAVEEVNIEDADPVKGILDCAREYEVDLIVLGRHEASRLDHFFHGDTVHRIIDEAPCDVIVTRTPLHGQGREKKPAA